MSDELDRMDVTEGTIVGDDTPFSSRQQAEAAINEALILMRDGSEMADRGTALLLQAERRGAHQILGFESMKACVDSIAASMTWSIGKADRLPLVAELRMKNLDTSSIARFMGVSDATAARSLVEARGVGLLDDEPDKVVTKDGRTRPTTRSPEAARPGRRTDFTKSWRNRDDTLRKLINSFEAALEDDRCEKWFATEAGDYVDRGEIPRAIAVLNRVMEQYYQARNINS